jgi:hypothetical protein
LPPPPPLLPTVSPRPTYPTRPGRALAARGGGAHLLGYVLGRALRLQGLPFLQRHLHAHVLGRIADQRHGMALRPVVVLLASAFHQATLDGPVIEEIEPYAQVTGHDAGILGARRTRVSRSANREKRNGAPNGIRTRDLHLERVASKAARR